MDSFQSEVGRWAERTFAQSTPGSVVAHLRREVEELGAATMLGPFEDEMNEAADCLLLLLHLAHKRRFSLLGAAQRKFEEIQERQWGEPDAEGVVEHKR
jgi:NTP pyrophosphatase (non-canonical NTP hydrolase)